MLYATPSVIKPPSHWVYEFWTKHKDFSGLSKWSRTTFGNIFQQIATPEDVVRVNETRLEISIEVNKAILKKSNAELKRYLKIEEERGRNTRFFHSYVKGKEESSTSKYKLDKGTGSQQVEYGEEAIHVFKDQFQETQETTDYSICRSIPRLITDERSWNIIGDDITNMVKAFFCGQELPRYLTHTNLVLIPKKEVVTTFGDLRPISLSTFANKIISRLMHERMVVARRGSYHVTKRALSKIAFKEQPVFRIVNGQSYGFFQSSGFETKGSIISTLFIIGAEVLARSLNNLFEDPEYKGYGMPKWSPKINHLSYADDTILFCSGQPSSVRKMMKNAPIGVSYRQRITWN
ncbi:hypothetical protein H5410_048139 [Solanum commersonii]|uniref:Reverse transcriptase domain-containing protein n=1 Tax=Solanum commersonii TaxID=4109 RepID=A0A9J5XH82_SOLCO|nr:hypothetical protein H5410_048139 [Solanum commersonii]